MLNIGIKNLDKVVDQLSAWMEKVEQETADVANGITVEMFNQILADSPQYSGDFTGNWKYSINEKDRHFELLNLHGLAQDWAKFIRGDMPAILYAKGENKGRDTNYKLGDTFYLSNSASHDEDYALKIENGRINFRDGNHGDQVKTALRDVSAKYAVITKQQARNLARKKL